MDFIKIHPDDNVRINIENGHKYALTDIKAGENVIKYGFPIGHATEDIKAGEHVHSHNLKTNLGEIIEYSYNPEFSPLKAPEKELFFNGYRRKNGEAGIRNDVWIIPTVGCVNKAAESIAAKTGALAFTHPYGCSQLGGDQDLTRTVLAGLIKHPNAGGVLVLGLGCENSNIGVLKSFIGEYDSERVRFLTAQEVGDEIAEGVRIVKELQALCETDKREEIPLKELKIGLKCGGSDGYSGITANPLVGSLSDRIISYGGSSVLTEVPEMFGAETLLMKRCINEEVFNKNVDLINNFKAYYTAHNQVIYENPSPGNKAGGITTLEEKSLGCVQKGGKAPVVDVLDYGDRLSKNGLSLLNGPGNDIVAITNLTAAGVHIILFTTGRGTPLGAPVPTVKVATNSSLAERKQNWVDFNAGRLLDGVETETLTDELLAYVIEVANGKQTASERNGFREIAIFKDGVTL